LPPLSASLLDRQVELLPAGPEDELFLRALYATRRARELEGTGWGSAQVKAFCDMQFDAQERHYARFHDSAFSGIIYRGGARIGRLYVDFNATPALHLIDIGLIPEAQGQGLGGALLGWLLETARATFRPVTLQVAFDNPARHLYERLGFTVTQQGFPYWSMQSGIVALHPAHEPS
jgi:ribosomal protein S18 acetylase RimI-like enzyme